MGNGHSEEDSLMGMGMVSPYALERASSDLCLRVKPPLIKRVSQTGLDISPTSLGSSFQAYRPGPSTLLEAARAGSVAQLEALLDAGADLDEVDSAGDTALLVACRRGELAVVKALVEAGSQVEVVNKKGETAMALVEARRPYSRQLVRYLRYIMAIPHIPWTQVKVPHDSPVVGQGNFGVVFRGEYLGAVCAAKVPKDQCPPGTYSSTQDTSEMVYYATASEADYVNVSCHPSPAKSSPAFHTSASKHPGNENAHQKGQGNQDTDSFVRSVPADQAHKVAALRQQLADRRDSIPRPEARDVSGPYQQCDSGKDQSGKPQPAERSLDQAALWRRRQRNHFREFLHEALICTRIGSKPHVVPFRGAHLSLHQSCLVFEFMPGNDLGQYLRALPTPPKFSLLMKLLAQAASGLWALHSVRVVHRDVSARNFLVGEQRKVYICDFGLSRELDEGKSRGLQQIGDKVPCMWMAPEAWKYGVYSFESDVYMFGIFLFESFTRQEYPYPELIAELGFGKAHVVAARRASTGELRPSIPSDCPPGLAALMQRCWAQDPAERPSMKTVTNMLKALSHQGGAVSPVKMLDSDHKHAAPLPPLAKLLSDLKLTQYEKDLTAAGYDDVESLEGMSVDRLCKDVFSLRPGHANKLAKRVAKLLSDSPKKRTDVHV
eukprot:g75321.t1